MTTTPPEDRPSEDRPSEEGIPSESPDLRPEQIVPPPGAAPSAAAAGPKRLYRSRSDQWLGGVAAGLAEYFDADPTLVRIAFAVLALVSAGVVFIAYVGAWIIIPEDPREGDTERARGGGDGNAGLVWGLILIAVGAVILLAQLDLDIDFSLWQVGASAALILVGALIVLQARRGLHGGLMTLAILLTIALGTTRVLDVNLQFDGAFGQSRVHVQSLEDLERSYAHAFGQLTVDLRELEVPPGETVRVDVDVVFGQAIVRLPPDVPTRIRAESAFGSIEGDAVEVSGIISNRDYTPPGWAAAERRIDLSITSVFGSGRIR